MRLILSILMLWWLLVPSLLSGGELPPAPERVRVLCYNTYNFQALAELTHKSLESREAVADIIAVIDPHIMVLIEIMGETALVELQQMLAERQRDYPFASLVQGEDTERNLAVLAKFAPVEVCHDAVSYYNLGGRHVKVQRGFAHCVFQWANNYKLHVLGAHLKSKMFHRLGQTDMRRYEARQLRYLYNRIIEQDPTANVLVVGDMNDTPDSSPISTLCGRRYKTERQLFDLRPLDKFNMGWTHLWDEAETYSRIDYIFASYHLLGEVDFEQTHIPFIAEWYIASDHRPLVVTIRPEGRDPPEEALALFERNVRQSPAPPSSFHEGRVVGTRKARR